MDMNRALWQGFNGRREAGEGLRTGLSLTIKTGDEPRDHACAPDALQPAPPATVAPNLRWWRDKGSGAGFRGLQAVIEANNGPLTGADIGRPE